MMRTPFRKRCKSFSNKNMRITALEAINKTFFELEGKYLDFYCLPYKERNEWFKALASHKIRRMSAFEHLSRMKLAYGEILIQLY